VRALARELGLGIDLYQPFRDFEAVPGDVFDRNLHRARHHRILTVSPWIVRPRAPRPRAASGRRPVEPDGGRWRSHRGRLIERPIGAGPLSSAVRPLTGPTLAM